MRIHPLNLVAGLIIIAFGFVFSVQVQADSTLPASNELARKNVPEIEEVSKKVFASTDEELQALQDWLGAAKTQKDISYSKKKINEIAQPLATLDAGIKYKISSSPESADELKQTKDDTDKRETCLNDLNNAVNKALRLSKNFSVIVCGESSFASTFTYTVDDEQDDQVTIEITPVDDAPTSLDGLPFAE